MCSEVWSDAIFRTSEKQMSFLAHDYGSLSKRVHYVSGGDLPELFDMERRNTQGGEWGGGEGERVAVMSNSALG